MFTSDAHYGTTRAAFRGSKKVSAQVVNEALVAAINAVPNATYPADGGVKSGRKVGAIDFVIQAGDIANRQEGSGTSAIQPAAVSWSQFRTDYVDGLRLKDKNGKMSPLLLLPGNHDISNAIGFYRTMTPSVDATSMAEIYNHALQPSTRLTAESYDYGLHKVNYSKDIGGVHFAFVNMWPDSEIRAWLKTDLEGVSAGTPVVLFTHDQPDAESKHFTNPNGAHAIDAKDKFENLLVDHFADARTVNDASGEPIPSTIEQRALVAFLKAHPNLSAYFHGNENYTELYDYTGPDRDIALHTFRVDSPMKGKYSASDETRLAFEVAAIDVETQKMTVRECLWNTRPGNPDRRTEQLEFGVARSVALAVPIRILGALTATPAVAALGQGVSFSVKAAGGAPSTVYSWDFGDGESATGADVVHTFWKPGEKTVKLTVSDGSTAATGSVSTRIMASETGDDQIYVSLEDRGGRPGPLRVPR